MDQRPMLLAGEWYHPGEGFRTGWVRIVAGKVESAGDGAPPVRPDVEGIGLPAFVNAHTHIGDHVGRGIDLTGRTLHEVVAPPDGIKHRLLRDTPANERLAGMRAAVREMARHGCVAFIDFREQGVEGSRMLREATRGTDVRAIILGRPAGEWDDEEALAVLEVSDGFGLSALRDSSDDTPERMAAMAHREGKRFALHLSEGQREDVGRALDLKPDFLVHMVQATDDDLSAVAAARTPIVVCPRSNALFGPLPPVARMLDAGIPLALGSDNAMFHSLDPLHDARLLHERQGIGAATLLDALTLTGPQLADGGKFDPFAPGSPARFILFQGEEKEPMRTLFGATPPRVQMTTLEVST